VPLLIDAIALCGLDHTQLVDYILTQDESKLNLKNAFSKELLEKQRVSASATLLVSNIAICENFVDYCFPVEYNVVEANSVRKKK